MEISWCNSHACFDLKGPMIQSIIACNFNFDCNIIVMSCHGFLIIDVKYNM